MIDPLLIAWIVIWTCISSYGLYLILTDDKQASSFYVYGKSLESTKKKGLFWSLFLVPKRYFRHFYILSSLLFTASLFIALIYYTNTYLKIKLIALLEVFQVLTQDSVKIETANDLHDITTLVFTLILMIIQCSRRLYESLFVSVYSQDAKINVIHYAFGHAFYLLAVASTLGPLLLSKTSDKHTIDDIFDNLVNRRRAIAFVLFVSASLHQHRCHTQLANLRKDKAGRVITNQYYVPAGGLFEFVSCPHFTLEVILYLVIVCIQGFSCTYWNMIFALVLTTQTINALTEHKWYKRKYKDYPKTRRAIFPRLL